MLAPPSLKHNRTSIPWGTLFNADFKEPLLECSCHDDQLIPLLTSLANSWFCRGRPCLASCKGKVLLHGDIQMNGIHYVVRLRVVLLKNNFPFCLIVGGSKVGTWHPFAERVYAQEWSLWDNPFNDLSMYIVNRGSLSIIIRHFWDIEASESDAALHNYAAMLHEKHIFHGLLHGL